MAGIPTWIHGIGSRRCSRSASAQAESNHSLTLRFSRNTYVEMIASTLHAYMRCHSIKCCRTHIGCAEVSLYYLQLHAGTDASYKLRTKKRK